MSVDESGSDSEHFAEDVGSDEAEEAEEFVADGGIEEGTDSDEVKTCDVFFFC
jgi:hypothetical protein